MASVAAGNSGVDVRIPGQRAGSYAGAAPQARLAVYKACWTTPDPRHDGCSTADLVTAVDRAVTDRVDVLNVSVDGQASAPCRHRRPRARVAGCCRGRHRRRRRIGQPRHDGVRRPRLAVGHVGRRHHRRHASWRGGGARPAADRCDGRARRDPTHPRGAGRAGHRRRVDSGAVAPLPAGQPRRGPGVRTHRGVRTRRHRPGRQVRGRAPRRRRRHGAPQHQPRPGDRRLPPAADRPPDQGRRAHPAGVAAQPPRAPGVAAARRRAAHSGAPGRVDQFRRPGRRVREARHRRHRRGRAGGDPAVQPRPPLGPRLRHVCRRRSHQRHRRSAAQPARLVGRRGPLGPGHVRRQPRGRPLPAPARRRPHPRPGGRPPRPRLPRAGSRLPRLARRRPRCDGPQHPVGAAPRQGHRGARSHARSPTSARSRCTTPPPPPASAATRCR